MNKKTLNILEYNKIIQLLEAEAGCPMSKAKARALTPYSEAHLISEELRSTTEAVDLIVHKGALPVGGIYDIENEMSFARKGGTLTMKQLLQIHYNLSAAIRIVEFARKDCPPMPTLNQMIELLVGMPRLADNIDRCILSEDEMNDNASPQLRDIRRSIARQNEAIRVKMNHIIGASDNRLYLQDALVTMRDGRYVIPVKQEHRSRFPGIIHDQSKGGQTVFIEPQVIVNLNNELRELEMAEQAEILRILAELSSNCAEHYNDIMNNQKIMIALDFAMAKGKLSCKMRASEPEISTDGVIDIRRGRHPLIDPEKVVPISVSIGDGYRTLVVTGPNTGGKTVTLKTIGLMAMMAQSGLHIPAGARSRIPVFTEIYADIGDEQSIEQSLSTFSSHMKNIVHIVERADARSLVLIDELGAGTDPTEGAALAIAILEKIAASGAMIAATTHYNEIKKYALATDGVENACMEFDVETLSPTYKLLVGVPGRSNAFEISAKLGLGAGVIERAGALIENKDMEFEDVISSIEEDKKRAEAERDEAVRISEALKAQQAELEAKLAELEKKKEKIVADARAEARDILRDAKSTAKEVQRELKQLSKVQSLGERNKRFDKSRKKLKEKEDKYAEKIIRQFNADPVKASDIRVGDRVRVLSLDQNGEILSLPDSKGEVSVQVGIMKANLKLEDLVLINDGTKGSGRAAGSGSGAGSNAGKSASTWKSAAKKAGKSGGGKAGHGELFRAKAQNISINLNVQGKYLDDAIEDVIKYIDDAYIAGLSEVTIIHGRGEGILQRGIRSMLKKHKNVDSFRAGAYNEGGEGVTVVKLKV